ncbi:MAG: AAA family ATPase [Oscillospiraceae bacterium]|nr:AAA family ATPase [Oscillospiraceae bacterium]
MGELKLIKLADIQARNVEWLWEPYLPKGKVSILRGHPGEGKSMFIMALISALSTGDPLFNEEDRREPVACVYQSAEDALDDTIKPRLDAAFADCERVFTIDERNDPLSFTDSRIEQAIRDTSAGLMILDPLQAYLGANVDMYRANEVRPVLTGLVDVSARTGCAILLVEHMNKMKGASAITKGLGSMDITGAARSVLLLGRANDHSPEVYLAHVKSNLAPRGQTLVFITEDNRMYFVGASDISANQLLDCADAPEYRETKSDQVEASLLEYFMDSEEIPCQQVYDFYGGNGISKRTVDGAKKKLGIRSVKRGDAWYWVRPDSIPPQRKNEGCNLVST